MVHLEQSGNGEHGEINSNSVAQKPKEAIALPKLSESINKLFGKSQTNASKVRKTVVMIIRNKSQKGKRISVHDNLEDALPPRKNLQKTNHCQSRLYACLMILWLYHRASTRGN